MIALCKPRSMAALSISLAAWSFTANGTAADTGGSTPIPAVRPPGTPAFALLGTELTSIDRPATPRAVGVGLLSALSEGPLPSNYAIEVAPFWLVGQPSIAFEDRYGTVGWDAFAQTFSLSLATSTAEDEGSPTRFGFGLRGQLVGGAASEELKRAHAELGSVIGFKAAVPDPDETCAPDPNRAGELFNDLNELCTKLTRLQEIRRQAADLRAEVEKRVATGVEEHQKASLADDLALHQFRKEQEEELSQQAHAARAALLEKVEDKVAMAKEALRANSEPVGLAVEVAGGGVVDFAEQEISNASWSQWGAWLVPSYRFEGAPVALLGLGRLLRDETAGSSTLDLGGRVLVQSGAGVSVGFEYVQRTRLAGRGPTRTFRAVGTVEYPITESTYLAAMIGKNFDLGDSDLISIAGLRVDIGPGPTLK